MTSGTSSTNEVPVIFSEKNLSSILPLAASSPGTYAKKYGKENVPKNINLVNDELPHRVGAQSDCQVTAQSACQAGEKTLRAGRDGSISRSHPPAVLKGNPKPLTEDKKKSVQFVGGDGHTKTGG